MQAHLDCRYYLRLHLFGVKIERIETGDFGWERKLRDFGGEKMVGSSPQKNGEKMRRRRG